MERYFDNYKGIIIQNDDPEKIGRVKVFIPHISMTLYEGWNNDRDNDKIFTGLGANINSSLKPEILERLKNCLPWARVKQPIFGMSSSMTYHADKDFSEIANDSDNATQHQETNKQDTCSEPSQNNFSSLKTAIEKVATPPPNSSKELLNYNTSYETPEFINNSAISDPTILSSPEETIPDLNDNIEQVIITFTPNSRNARNLHRRFTTTVETSNGDVTVGAGSSQFTKTFGSNTSSKVPYTPPITYTPSINSVTSNSSSNNTTNSSPFIITFIPNSRNSIGNNSNRRFTTTAEIIDYDGQSITAYASAKGLKSKKEFIIDKEDIDNINVVYNDPTKPVNLNSERFGNLSPLMQEYTQTPSGPQSNAIMPPMPIPSPSGCNRGGGGAELFSLVWTNLVPMFGIFNTLFGGPNPENKTAVNHNREISSIIDPNKTVGTNMQLPADSKEPIRSSTQNNKVKGMISIPAVGAIVSVYFDNGDPFYPIVDGWFPTQEDFLGVHDVS